MRIRAAEPGDLPAIVEIEGLCFPEETAFPPGMFAYLIRYSIVLVASETDNKVVGFIIGYPSGRAGAIYTLDVHPDYRRLGIGSSLIEALEEELQAYGAKSVRLEAAIDNPDALELYRRSGYQEKELVMNYYGRGKNAVRMWKVLS